jgi:transposase InsO family protein
MARKRFIHEQIIGMLREAEARLSQGEKVKGIRRNLGITEQLRDEALNREVFFTLKEAKVVIENWRLEYNTIRSHSSFNGLPPASEAILPFNFRLPNLIQNTSEWSSTFT